MAERKRRRILTSDPQSSAKRRKSNDGSAVTDVLSAADSKILFAEKLSNEKKSRTLRSMLDALTDIDLSKISGWAIITLACEHRISRKAKNLLLNELQAHSCAWSCLVRVTDAQQAGELSTTESSESSETIHCSRLLLPNKDPSFCATTRKRQRKAVADHSLQNSETDKEEWAKSWPQVEPQESLEQFGMLLILHSLEMLLVICVHYNRPEIRSHSLHDGHYQACTTCATCVKKHRFVTLPLYSWANGCWVGPMPTALSGLTYAEELVIACTTKCWAKLNAG
ncbi:hypothetical protein C8R44DRAFT_747177 [Mycena epipterygia]|nr:hypothetical protein C8R44DRAFT_747177 [Mycena epipterygia]